MNDEPINIQFANPDIPRGITHAMTIGGETFQTNPVAIPMTNEMLKDAASIRTLMTAMFDRAARPWKYPDAPALRHIDPLPEFTRLADRWHAIRHRVVDIVHVARHGRDETDI